MFLRITGPNCEDYEPACTLPSPCGPDAECLETVGTNRFVCLCNPGFIAGMYVNSSVKEPVLCIGVSVHTCDMLRVSRPIGLVQSYWRRLFLGRARLTALWVDLRTACNLSL